ncbi:MAG: hypothetical protein AB7S74_01875 [Hyphomicrobium sp.]
MQTRTSDAGAPPVARSRLLNDLIPIVKVCEQLGVTRFTLRGYQRDPVLGFPKSVKLGRNTYISEAALKRWLTAQTGCVE